MRKMEMIIYFFICFIQPIMLPTPEAATVITGSAVLGAFNAFILGLIASVLGIITMYLVSKKYSTIIIKKFFKEEHIDKYKKFVQKNEIILTGALFILPILPDEIVCIGAGIIGISFRTITIIAIVTKAITIFTYAYSLELADIINVSTTEMVIIELAVLIIFSLINNLIKRRKTAA